MAVQVLCIGHAAYDITMYLPEYPPENSKAETYESLECGGGPAANAAYTLSKWGIKTAFAGLVGKDLYGQAIEAEFREVKVNTSLLELQSGHQTPASVILVSQDNASRTIVNRKSQAQPFHLDPERLEKMDPEFLLFDGHELEASLDAMDAFPDAVTILDAGSMRPGTQTLAEEVDYLLTSERFAKQICGLPALGSEAEFTTALDCLTSICPGCVVITLGERGLVYCDDGRPVHIPAYNVEAVDTTAAGDIFHGAFVYGLTQDLSTNECLSIASSAAALSVGNRGGRTSIPTLKEVQQFLAHPPEPPAK